MREDADAAVLAVDGRRCAVVGRVERPALDVDVAGQIGQPVAELQSRVAERFPQRVAQAPGAGTGPSWASSRATAAVANRPRSSPATNANGTSRNATPPSAEKIVRPSEPRNGLTTSCAPISASAAPPRHEHQPQAGAVRGRGRAPTADEQRHGQRDDRESAHRGGGREQPLRIAAVDDREGARRAVGTARLPGRDQQVCSREAERGRVGEDHDALGPARQRARPGTRAAGGRTPRGRAPAAPSRCSTAATSWPTRARRRSR